MIPLPKQVGNKLVFKMQTEVSFDGKRVIIDGEESGTIGHSFAGVMMFTPARGCEFSAEELQSIVDEMMG